MTDIQNVLILHDLWALQYRKVDESVIDINPKLVDIRVRELGTNS